jgi:hypothetical protein
MGTRHLYWVLTGPSFAVYRTFYCKLYSVNYVQLAREAASHAEQGGGCGRRHHGGQARPLNRRRGVSKQKYHHGACAQRTAE